MCPGITEKQYRIVISVKGWLWKRDLPQLAFFVYVAMSKLIPIKEENIALHIITIQRKYFKTCLIGEAGQRGARTSLWYIWPVEVVSTANMRREDRHGWGGAELVREFRAFVEPRSANKKGGKACDIIAATNKWVAHHTGGFIDDRQYRHRGNAPKSREASFRRERVVVEKWRKKE